MKKILLSLSSFFSIFLYSQKLQSDPTIVIFSYDEAGNQIFRGPTGPVCTSCRIEEAQVSNSSLFDQIAYHIQAAPVPVKTDLTVIWDNTVKDYISKIELVPYNAFRIMETVNVRSLADNSYIFSMGSYPYGVYYLKFYLTDGNIYTRTVTKK
ncbi:hypothetical protein [Epilithonimonas sp.]|uniref:hypothetical protein n=1 Tax=Epilithonimonas sp. TaxID=2894511 RepID=UPI0028A13DEE|nr:hypothetical protein [Epilithonimonas sp.]